MLAEYILTISRYGIALLAVLIFLRCCRSLLKGKDENEIWAYLRVGDTNMPVTHWESIIGRARSADLRIFGEGLSRLHAVLRRDDRGAWQIYDIFSGGGVWVNDTQVLDDGIRLRHGDVINLGGSCVRFLNIDTAQRARNEHRRTGAGKAVSPTITLCELTALQALLALQHSFSAPREALGFMLLSFLSLVILEWCMFEGMRLIDRNGFEVELIAFFLTSLGLSVAISSAPADSYKQVLLIVASVFMFLLSGWWMRSLRRTNAVRIPAGLLALALLALNILTSDRINGAKSWLQIGGLSMQPSELVKVFYIYVGAATLDALYMKRNLYAFIMYSAACVCALAIIGDFGTALIFFITFLVISFMRSGSLATVLLAITGAVLAGVLALTVKPYIARRFATWGHVWEDVYAAGYQQAHAISAAASGGLVGKGAGAGWLKNITYSETDMVFAFVCEEQGLVVAVCMVLSIVLLAFFALKSARTGRSAFYSITACAGASMLLVQLALNVFGSLDMLPFTGVTFPFVSRGGSSLISCWMMMAFFKGADNRRGASFAVNPVKKIPTWEEENGIRVANEQDYYDLPAVPRKEKKHLFRRKAE